MKICAVALASMAAVPTVVAGGVDRDWNFLVMGDWGGQETAPYYTNEESITAVGMGMVADEESSRYALALGDNFYSHGITSTTSARWNNTFENVFTASSLQGDDYFRVLLGNHDHLGSPEAEIQYSNISKRWRMDDYYWAFSETTTVPGGHAGGNMTLDTVFIDTVTWAGADHVVDEFGGVHSVDGDALPGPSDQAAANAQLEWLESQLKSSTADFIIVAGHYPVYSICEHGTTAALSNLIPLLEKYGVAAYLNGHDHCQQYIDDGKGVQYHTIGSAHHNDPSTAHNATVPPGSLKWHVGTEDGNTGGFGAVTITAEGLTVRHYAGNGTVVYQAPTVPARKQQLRDTAAFSKEFSVKNAAGQ